MFHWLEKVRTSGWHRRDLLEQRMKVSDEERKFLRQGKVLSVGHTLAVSGVLSRGQPWQLANISRAKRERERGEGEKSYLMQEKQRGDSQLLNRTGCLQAVSAPLLTWLVQNLIITFNFAGSQHQAWNDLHSIPAGGRKKWPESKTVRPTFFSAGYEGGGFQNSGYQKAWQSPWAWERKHTFSLPSWTEAQSCIFKHWCASCKVGRSEWNERLTPKFQSSTVCLIFFLHRDPKSAVWSFLYIGVISHLEPQG